MAIVFNCMPGKKLHSIIHISQCHLTYPTVSFGSHIFLHSQHFTGHSEYKGTMQCECPKLSLEEYFRPHPASVLLRFYFPIVKLRRVERLKAYEPFNSLSTNCFHCTRPFLLFFDFFFFLCVVCLFVCFWITVFWPVGIECLSGFSIRMCRWCAGDRTNLTLKAWSEEYHQALSTDIHQKDLSYSEVWI